MEARGLRWCDLHCFTETVYGLVGIGLPRLVVCRVKPPTSTCWWNALSRSLCAALGPCASRQDATALAQFHVVLLFFRFFFFEERKRESEGKSVS